MRRNKLCRHNFSRSLLQSFAGDVFDRCAEEFSLNGLLLLYYLTDHFSTHRAVINAVDANICQ